MAEQVDFESFRTSWLQSVQQGAPSTVELGRRFALKLITQWLDASETTADLVYCDGSGDGGIDVAFLDEGPDSASDAPEESGHAWYLVQSKYGSAFAGAGTLLTEGQKVIETLDGRRPRLNSWRKDCWNGSPTSATPPGRPTSWSSCSRRSAA
jgi:hypothetical protein